MPIKFTIKVGKIYEKIKLVPHRIPYEIWSNGQLSIAKYYGGCKLNGKDYLLDYENCETKGEGDEKKYFPDLVEVLN